MPKLPGFKSGPGQGDSLILFLTIFKFRIENYKLRTYESTVNTLWGISPQPGIELEAQRWKIHNLDKISSQKKSLKWKASKLTDCKKYKKDFLLGTVLSWRKVSMRSSVKRDWLNSRTRSPTLMVSSRILKNKSILFECSTSPMT